ncbi:uncharacterized protein [Amphiura filiformis]|uniref:uncharacterized protein n=1 Tax=Amphiura filiformis TaxID=82378 RepID=UPI003B218DF5
MASSWMSRWSWRFLQFLLFLVVLVYYVKTQTCVYYASARDATPQGDLPNCTWYRSKSCCKRTEVSAVMDSMAKIHENTKACANRLHYMMCYFCSPNQIDWYDEGKVFICKEFCDETYAECATMKLGEKVLGDEYASGTELCQAQSFQVVNSGDRCFNFDSSVFDSASHGSLSMVLAVMSVVAVVALGR